MTYQIAGLDPARSADTGSLIADGAIRTVADKPKAYPCRVTLADAQPGEADAGIRTLLSDDEILYVDAHNAAYGCFLARATRDAG